MRLFWLSLLQTIAHALRASARLWERAAQAVDGWLVEEREPEPPGSDPPAEWLAAVEQREPPVQWLEHVHRRQPQVRFQHYRAASAPPSPAVRRLPARDRTPAGRRPQPVAAPRPATAAPRVAPAGRQTPAPPAPSVKAAGQSASSGAPRRAARRGGALVEQSISWPEGEPDAQSGAAAEAVSVAAPRPPAERRAPTFPEGAGREPGRLPSPSAESKRSAPARLLARARRLLSGRAASAPDRESPRVPAWLPESAPHSMQWPPPEPFVEEAPVLGPWPSLPDEAVRGRAASASVPRAEPEAPSVVGLAPFDPWPSLPHIPYGVGEGSPAADEPDADQRALRRRQRLDDEQRGVLWNGSIY